MILVSYYSDPVTKIAAQRLIESAVKFGLLYDIQGISGSEGLKSRAEFIRQMLNKWADHSVLYVEATGLVRRPFDIIAENSFDMAAYVLRPASAAPSKAAPFDGTGWIYPLTFLFTQKERSRQVLERWIESNRSHPNRSEADNLRYFLAEEPVLFKHLPPEYCWVERIMRTTMPEALPVIEHVAPWIKGGPEILPWEEKRPFIIFRSFTGLGDTFYMRPIVRKIVEREGMIYFVNPWPQLFWDQPKVKVLQPESVSFRTQKENINRVPSEMWAGKFTGGLSKLLEYDDGDFKAGKTIIQAFLDRGGPAKTKLTEKDFRFEVPRSWIEDWMYDLPRPLGIVHPPTIRKEWENPSRNPKPEHIQELVGSAPWINWISVAWTKEKEEWFEGPPLKGIYKSFDRGELSTESLIALVSIADFVVTGPCFLLPMGAATGTPIFTVFGGSVPPEILIDPIMGQHVSYIAPDPFCDCLAQGHECKKDIGTERLSRKFTSFLSRISL